MNDIAIWPDTDFSSSIVHFWFEQDGHHRRICDSRLWEDGEAHQSEQSASPTPCPYCKSLYLEDVLYGKKVLRIEADPPLLKKDIVPAYNGVYSPKIGGTQPLEGDVMPKIPMSSFARFYEVRPAEQVRIVRDIRTRLMAPDRYITRDYYAPLRNTLRATHWATNDIGYFEDALEPFLEKQKLDRRDHFRSVSESYVSYWRNVEGTYFAIPPVDVTISDLTIAVRPEVGLQSAGGDYHVLKLWFNADRPTRQARQIMVYLMDKANEQSGEWNNRWYSAIWDIRRQNIPQPVKAARDLELGLTGQIAAFLHIWDELDRRSQEGDLPY